MNALKDSTLLEANDWIRWRLYNPRVIGGDKLGLLPLT
jgi:hypothetical protein